MAHPAIGALSRVAAIIAIAALTAGCATRYDTAGNQIYVWQFGQDTSRDVDYSNPRMPILPRQRPSADLWPAPSPYDFTDLSPWSFLQEPEPLTTQATSLIACLGDNAGCAAFNDKTARLALAAPRADDRGDRGTRLLR